MAPAAGRFSTFGVDGVPQLEGGEELVMSHDQSPIRSRSESRFGLFDLVNQGCAVHYRVISRYAPCCKPSPMLSVCEHLPAGWGSQGAHE